MSIESQNEAGITDTEAKALLASLFANGFGISGHRVGNGAVAVNLLKGDLPFVVAFHAGKGDHGEQRPRKPLHPGVVVRAGKLPVAVEQQLPGHMLPGHRHVYGQAVGLGIPVGGPAVFFPGESLGANVQAGVLPRIGGKQMEQIEADALLGRLVAVDAHIRHLPAAKPSRLVGRKSRVEPRLRGLLRHG